MLPPPMTQLKRHYAVLPTCLLTLLACGDPHAAARPEDGGTATDGNAQRDSSAATRDAMVTGGLPPLGGSTIGDPASGPRPFPVRRLALGSSADALCVVLKDRTLHCENSGTDVSARIENNRDFVWVNAAPESDQYVALRSDGSTASLHQFVDAPTSFRVPHGVYIDLFSENAGACGLLDDGTIDCQGAEFPTVLPKGPFLQIAGNYTQQSFLGLRTDGVLVSSNHDHLTVVAPGLHFTDFDGNQQIPGCGRVSDGSFACFDYGAGDGVVVTTQAAGALRDYAQFNGAVCFVFADGRAECRDPLGVPSMAAPQAARFVDIETRGPENTCGITEAGAVLCWGASADEAARQIVLPMSAAVD
ncbi:MAG: hypothetical protein JWN04_3236 [Myxococcaceae bacterium]|nr:hypothetical protein [Myxococcaceae bacterium]